MQHSPYGAPALPDSTASLSPLRRVHSSSGGEKGGAQSAATDCAQAGQTYAHKRISNRHANLLHGVRGVQDPGTPRDSRSAPYSPLKDPPNRPLPSPQRGCPRAARRLCLSVRTLLPVARRPMRDPSHMDGKRDAHRGDGSPSALPPGISPPDSTHVSPGPDEQPGPPQPRRGTRLMNRGTHRGTRLMNRGTSRLRGVPRSRGSPFPQTHCQRRLPSMSGRMQRPSALTKR